MAPRGAYKIETKRAPRNGGALWFDPHAPPPEHARMVPPKSRRGPRIPAHHRGAPAVRAAGAAEWKDWRLTGG
jgi:hypothetical protein